MTRVSTIEWVDENDSTLIRLRADGRYSVLVGSTNLATIRELRDACNDILRGCTDGMVAPDPAESRAMGVPS